MSQVGSENNPDMIFGKISRPWLRDCIKMSAEVLQSVLKQDGKCFRHLVLDKFDYLNKRVEYPKLKEFFLKDKLQSRTTKNYKPRPGS